ERNGRESARQRENTGLGKGRALQTAEMSLPTSGATTTSTVDVVIIGATGYAGQELVRILARHPYARVTAAMGSATMEAPRKLQALARIWDGEILPYSEDRVGSQTQAVFLALPDASAADTAPALLARGKRVIDLSGAFRIRDDKARQRWYPKTAALPNGTV